MRIYPWSWKTNCLGKYQWMSAIEIYIKQVNEMENGERFQSIYHRVVSALLVSINIDACETFHYSYNFSALSFFII